MRRASSAENASPVPVRPPCGLLDGNARRGHHRDGPLDFTDSIGRNVLVSALKRSDERLGLEGRSERDKDPPRKVVVLQPAQTVRHPCRPRASAAM